MFLFFFQFPHVFLQMTEQPNLMATNYVGTVHTVVQTAITMSAQQNNGTAQFFYLDASTLLPVDQSAPGPKLKIPFLPTEGLLVVVVLPPPGLKKRDRWGQLQLGRDGKPLPSPPLRLLFRIKDLYLIGYLWKLKWWLFRDIKLRGIINGLDINKHTQKLPYNGSYQRSGLSTNFTALKLGSPGAYFAYKVLTDETRRYTDEDRKEALSFWCVVISEGSRRLVVRRRVRRAFVNNTSETVDKKITIDTAKPKDAQSRQEASETQDGVQGSMSIHERQTSTNINNWSTDCGHVRAGVDGGLTEKEKLVRREMCRDIALMI